MNLKNFIKREVLKEIAPRGAGSPYAYNYNANNYNPRTYISPQGLNQNANNYNYNSNYNYTARPDGEPLQYQGQFSSSNGQAYAVDLQWFCNLLQDPQAPYPNTANINPEQYNIQLLQQQMPKAFEAFEALEREKSQNSQANGNVLYQWAKTYHNYVEQNCNTMMKGQRKVVDDWRDRQTKSLQNDTERRIKNYGDDIYNQNATIDDYNNQYNIYANDNDQVAKSYFARAEGDYNARYAMMQKAYMNAFFDYTVQGNWKNKLKIEPSIGYKVINTREFQAPTFYQRQFDMSDYPTNNYNIEGKPTYAEDYDYEEDFGTPAGNQQGAEAQQGNANNAQVPTIYELYKIPTRFASNNKWYFYDENNNRIYTSNDGKTVEDATSQFVPQESQGTNPVQKSMTKGILFDLFREQYNNTKQIAYIPKSIQQMLNTAKSKRCYLTSLKLDNGVSVPYYFNPSINALEKADSQGKLVDESFRLEYPNILQELQQNIWGDNANISVEGGNERYGNKMQVSRITGQDGKQRYYYYNSKTKQWLYPDGRIIPNETLQANPEFLKTLKSNLSNSTNTMSKPTEYQEAPVSVYANESKKRAIDKVLKEGFNKLIRKY